MSFHFLGLLCALSVLELSGILAAAFFVIISVFLGLITYRKDILISPALFIAVVYIFGFPLAFLAPELYTGLSSSIVSPKKEYGMLWALRGFSAFALGYVFVDKFVWVARKHDIIDTEACDSRISYTIYVLTSIGWLAILSWVAYVALFGFRLVFIQGEIVAVDSGIGLLQQILGMLLDLRYPFFLGFLMLHYWKKTDNHLFLLGALLLLASMIEIVSTGSKGAIIRLLLVGLLALAFLPVRMNLKQFVAGLVSLIVVYGSFMVITEYRTIMHLKNVAGIDVTSLEVQSESFRSSILGSISFFDSAENRHTKIDTEDIFNRLGDGMFSFSNLIEFTGQQPPYENALESFLVPVYSIVPRALLPEKPEFFNAARNATEYYGWSYGGISVTLLGSLYFAWGYAGIILGMGFIGGLVAYLAKQARLSSIYSPHWFILFIVLILPLLDVGGIFQAIITNFIRVAALLWLLNRLFPFFREAMNRRISQIMSTTHRGESI